MTVLTYYRVTFARIGRNRDVPALDAAAASADDLAAQVQRYARPYLLSQDVEVELNVDTGRGQIFAGGQPGGTFTVAAAS